MRGYRKEVNPMSVLARATFVALALFAIGCAGCARSAPLDEPVGSAPPMQIVVKFRAAVPDPASPTFVEQLSRSAGTALSYVRPLSGGAHVFRVTGLANAAQLQQALQKVAARPDVIYAEPDRKLSPRQ